MGLAELRKNRRKQAGYRSPIGKNRHLPAFQPLQIINKLMDLIQLTQCPARTRRQKFTGCR
ncbi:hypothetical protein D3C80_1956580 [compost metagenome]